MQFSLLGSGSEGNALYIRSGESSILIDNGLSYKQLRLRLEHLGQRPDSIRAVFITHEHSDHVKGVGVMARKTGVPVFVTPDTHRALSPRLGRLGPVEFFEAGERIGLGDFVLTSFSTSHDAVDPVGYLVECGGLRLGVATDLGHVPNLVIQRLLGCHGLILEANHCPRMLSEGPYPPHLQQRIRSRLGHLSNNDMTALLGKVLHPGLRYVVLAHLSKDNNCPHQVESLARAVLRTSAAQLIIARQDTPTPLLDLLAAECGSTAP